MEIGKKQRNPKKSLSRQVVDSIEEMIMERKLGPGDVLPTEIQISEELQVSKSSVREAIKMLEALGVVEIRRGLCTVISKNPEQGYMNVMLSHFYLNSGNEEDLQNFRYIIESAYTTYAIHQATDNDLAAIREKLELFREKLRNGTLEAEDDILFHGQILQATHNSFMISLGNALNELFRRSIAIAIRDNPEVALHDHESIYQAIVNRDPVAAEKVIAASARQWAASFKIQDAVAESTLYYNKIRRNDPVYHRAVSFYKILQKIEKSPLTIWNYVLYFKHQMSYVMYLLFLNTLRRHLLWARFITIRTVTSRRSRIKSLRSSATATRAVLRL